MSQHHGISQEIKIAQIKWQEGEIAYMPPWLPAEHCISIQIFSAIREPEGLVPF